MLVSFLAECPFIPDGKVFIPCFKNKFSECLSLLPIRTTYSLVLFLNSNFCKDRIMIGQKACIRDIGNISEFIYLYVR